MCPGSYLQKHPRKWTETSSSSHRSHQNAKGTVLLDTADENVDMSLLAQITPNENMLVIDLLKIGQRNKHLPNSLFLKSGNKTQNC